MSTAANLGRPDGIQFRPASQPQDGPDNRSPTQITHDLLTQAAQMNAGERPMRIRMGEPPRDYSAAYLLQQFQRNPDRFVDIMGRNGVNLLEFNEILDNAVALPENAGRLVDLAAPETREAFGLGDGNGVTFERTPARQQVVDRAHRQGAIPQAAHLSQEAVVGPNFWQVLQDIFGEIAEALARLFGSDWRYDSVTFDHRVDDTHFADIGRQLVESHGMEIWTAMQLPNGAAQLEEFLLAQRPESATEGQWQRAVSGIVGGIRAELAQNQALTGLPRDLSAAATRDALTFVQAHRGDPNALADLQLVLQLTAPDVRERALRNLVELPSEQRANMIALLTPPSELSDVAPADPHALLQELQQRGLAGYDPLTAAYHYRSLGERLAIAHGDSMDAYLFAGEVDGQQDFRERLLAARPPDVTEAQWEECVAYVMEGLDAGLERHYRGFAAHRVFAHAAPDAQATIFQILDRTGFRSAPDSIEMNDLVSAISFVPGGTAANEVTDENRPARAAVLETIAGLGLSRIAMVSNGQLVGGTPEQTVELNRQIQEHLDSTSAIRMFLGQHRSEVRITNPRLGALNTGQRRELTNIVGQQNVRFTFSGSDQTYTVQDTIPQDPQQALASGQISLQRYFADRAYRDQVLERLGLPAQAFESTLYNTAQSLRPDNAVGQANLRSAIQEAETRLYGSRSLTPQQREHLEAQLADNPDLPAEQQIAIRTVLFGDPSLTADQRTELERQLQLARSSLAAIRDPVNITIDLTRGTQLYDLFGLGAPNRADPVFFLAQSFVQDFHADFGGFEVQLPGSAGTLSRTQLGEILRAPNPEDAFAAFFNERGVVRPPEFRDTVVGFAHLAHMHNAGELPEGVVPLAGRGATRTLRMLGQRMTDQREGSLVDGSFLRQVFSAQVGIRADDATTFDSNAAFLGAAGNNRQQYGWFWYGDGNRTPGFESTQHAMGISRELAAAHPNRLANAFEALMGMESFDQAVSRQGIHQHGVSSGSVERMLDGVEPSQVRVLTTTGRAAAFERRAFNSSSQMVREMFVEHSGLAEGQVENLTNPTPEAFMAAARAEILRTDPPTGAVVLHFAGHTGANAFEVAGWIVTGADGSRAFISPAMLDELRNLAESHGVSLMVVADACRGGEFVDGARQRSLEQLGELPLTQDQRSELARIQSLNLLRTGVIGYHDAFLQAGALPARERPAPFPSHTELARLGAEALRSDEGLATLQRRVAEVLADESMPARSVLVLRHFVSSVESIREHREVAAQQHDAALSAAEQRRREGALEILSGDRVLQLGRPFATNNVGRVLEHITSDLDARLATLLEQAARPLAQEE